MIHYHNMEQLSPEWFKEKERKMSASNATPICANGAGLKTYCKTIALEYLGVKKESFTNSDIERGNRLEPIARSAYELETGCKVVDFGGITNDNYKNVWISPDGIIGDNGGCEIKARNDDKHFSLLLGETKEIPNNQIQMSLLVSEREWWDFISFNPNFSKPLFIKRIYPDTIYFEKLKAGFIEGSKLIEKYIKMYENYNIQIK